MARIRKVNTPSFDFFNTQKNTKPLNSSLAETETMNFSEENVNFRHSGSSYMSGSFISEDFDINKNTGANVVTEGTFIGEAFEN